MPRALARRLKGLRHMAASLALGLLVVAPAAAQSTEAPFFPDTVARSAFILDARTGSILFEKNADQPFAPASLAKLMTAEIALDAVSGGALAMTDSFPVSNHAWRTGGAPSRTATMFAAVRSQVPVEALLKGLAVHAANDAAIILAEGLDGTESAFAGHMNRRAGELGMTGSRFVNSTGLPQEGQATTARDMGVLARHLASAYPDAYGFYALPDFEWNRILQRNRNPLLRTGLGASGLATGFAEGEGFSIVGVFDKDDRRTIVTLSGLESDAARTRETVRLFEWTGANLVARTLFEANQRVGTAQVFGGLTSGVPAVVGEAVELYVPRKRDELVTASIRYDAPLLAPLRKGDRIGELDVKIDGRLAATREVFVGEDVPQGTFSGRAMGAIRELAFGWVRSL